MATETPKDFNPDTHVLAEDGNIYEKRIVAAHGVAAGMNNPGEPKTALAAAMEKAMTEAVKKGLEQGVTDPDEMRKLILAARDKVNS